MVPAQWTGRSVGVFVGISSSDYSQHLANRAEAEIDAYLATGNAHSVAAGRLSYSLGFTGPSLGVDTACSSSLVAVHLACQSLRNQECEVALAGGVNHILSPAFSINFSKAHMLAPDGRCKAFDAAADGFARGEGCGVVVLKRLSDVIAQGDNILALVRGSAVNQDGRSGGLTVPNGPSQQAVIRQALANANVRPEQVSYIEAHGTGTSLGDPIEVGALGSVFWPKPYARRSAKDWLGKKPISAIWKLPQALLGSLKWCFLCSIKHFQRICIFNNLALILTGLLCPYRLPTNSGIGKRANLLKRLLIKARFPHRHLYLQASVPLDLAAQMPM